MKLKFILPIATLAFAIFATHAVADHIDTFEDGNFVVATTTTFSNTQTVLTGAQGGARTVEVFAGGGGFAVSALSTAPVVDDSVTFATDSNTVGVYQFSYGSYSVAGALNLDILNISSAAQWTRLQIDYISNLTGTTSVTITDGSAISSVQATYNPGTSSMFFNYSDFITNSVGGPIDLTNIDGIRFDVIQANIPLPGSLSFSIFKRGGFLAIPEPGSLGLCLLGTAGIALRRRRRG